MSTKNIVLFGQSGVGKSSVINLMAGSQKAKTSPDAKSCTSKWEEHPVDFDARKYRVFDTVGLQLDGHETQEYVDAIMSTYSLITKLNHEGGAHLLLLCVRAGRFNSTIQNSYRLFREFFCNKKVPICLILTGLEGRENMESWWIENKHTFEQHSIDVDGRACITAVDGVHYEESRHLIRDLVVQHTQNGMEGIGPEECCGWFRRLVRKLKERYPKFFTPKKKQMVNILVKRCGIPPEVAEQVASRITQLENHPVASRRGTWETSPDSINQAEAPGAQAKATTQGSS